MEAAMKPHSILFSSGWVVLSLTLLAMIISCLVVPERER
jgi:hypothetical protein